MRFKTAFFYRCMIVRVLNFFTNSVSSYFNSCSTLLTGVLVIRSSGNFPVCSNISMRAFFTARHT